MRCYLNFDITTGKTSVRKNEQHSYKFTSRKGS